MTEKDRVVFLKGKKTILRPGRKETDLEDFVRWFNDPEISQYLSIYTPMWHDREAEWFDALGKSNTDIHLVIETLEGLAIGIMGIHLIDWKDRVGTTGAMIGEKEYWNKGYGSDAKMQLLNYAFNTLNLRKICSSVYAFNERSIHYNVNCGYQIEGTRKEQFFRNGKYWDEVMLGLFKEDWLPHWEKYQSEETK